MTTPAEARLWQRLRAASGARVGLGRVGNGLPTAAELAFRAAHAAARDAVHDPLDVPALVDALRGLGAGEPVTVRSRAADRREYLRRPDLGRAPDDLSALRPGAGELAVVCADGLSARAVAAHAPAVLHELLPRVGLTVAPPVVAVQARVALGDHIGAALGARVVLVLIGERPGLSAADGLGAYLTHDPRPGRTDAERNCVSNIRSTGGLDPVRAARVLAGLLAESLRLGESGVRVKDRGGSEYLTQTCQNLEI